jgi:nicotinamidase-related amidase
MKERDYEKTKRLLIVVDMVNGFLRFGAMSSQNIEHIVPEVENLVKLFIEDPEGQVALVKDTHTMNAREFKRYPIHCVINTPEAQNVDELLPYENQSIVIEKNSTSALLADGLLTEIEKMPNLEEVVIVGCCTDICVMNLAIPLQCYFDEHNKDISIVIPQNAVETYDAPNHNAEEWNGMAYRFMEQTGIKLVKKYERE